MDAGVQCLLGVRSYGLTDRGRVRPGNEDCFLIAELARSLRVRQASFGQPGTQFSECRAHVFMVADGMGGHQGGEVASHLCVETVENFLLNTLRNVCRFRASEEQSVLMEFQKALIQADTRLIQESNHHAELYGMGTTLTVAFVEGTKLFVAHVGDSRCYLLDQGELQQLTRDHNVAAEMVRRGLLSPEEAAKSRMRHVVTNVIGGAEQGVHVELHRVELRPGDTLLVCSDGVTGMLSDARIAEILNEENDPEDACQLLVAEANANGGKDNITAIVARFDSL
jgi:protein phosphatase